MVTPLALSDICICTEWESDSAVSSFTTRAWQRSKGEGFLRFSLSLSLSFSLSPSLPPSLPLSLSLSRVILCAFFHAFSLPLYLSFCSYCSFVTVKSACAFSAQQPWRLQAVVGYRSYTVLQGMQLENLAQCAVWLVDSGILSVAVLLLHIEQQRQLVNFTRFRFLCSPSLAGVGAAGSCFVAASASRAGYHPG